MSSLENFPFFVPSAKHGIRDELQYPAALSPPVIGAAVQHGVQHWNVGRVKLRPLEKESCCERVNEMFWIENTAQGVRKKQRRE